MDRPYDVADVDPTADFEDVDVEEGEDEEDVGYITPEQCWTVIAAYFDKKGLVSQQIDSFNRFFQSTVTDLIEEYSYLSLDQHTTASSDDRPIKMRRYEIKLGHTVLARPSMTESDGKVTMLLPYECRDRNLTYASPLYVSMKKKVSVALEVPIPLNELDEYQLAEMKQTGQHPTKIVWEEEESDPDPVGAGDKNEEMKDMVFVGRLPVMVKSAICHLYTASESSLFLMNECPYDQGGYFIINGSEKVLIAQERSAANIVQVFKKAQPSPISYQAEIRSALEGGSRLISSLQLKLYHKGEANRGSYGQTIHSTLPYVKSDLPIAIVFRALGVVSDEDILNHICYDRNDTQMLEMLRPCIEEAFCIQDREVALDYIGKRGNQTSGFNRDRRVKVARDILQKEMLPHISQSEGGETRKAFFLGYMVHRLLQCALGRRETDDRDHFGKKRLDLAGPLLAKLFRGIIRRLTSDLTNYLRRCVEMGRIFTLTLGVKSQTLSNGMKYSLATGNWGDQKKAMSSTAGVSQVLNRYTFASTLSHLRRTNTPIGRDGKLAKPRQLHNTHWGLVCPAETPEGQACGLVKNLSLMCYVSNGSQAEPINDFLISRNLEVLEEYEPLRHPNATKVFVNGVWVGVHHDPKHLVNTVQRLRRSHVLEFELSLVRDIRDREFKIFSDAGRVMRPLFVVEQNDNSPSGVEKGQLIITKQMIDALEPPKEEDKDRPREYLDWDGLTQLGAIEFLDAEEEETAMICMTPEDLEGFRQSKMEDERNRKLGVAGDATSRMADQPATGNARIKTKINQTTHMYTHCEIHPSMILGVCASIIPFPDHNQVCSVPFHPAVEALCEGTKEFSLSVC